jgi:hypothetical protein
VAICGCQQKETPAPDPVGDLKAHPGIGRVMLEFTTPENAVSGKVYYNSGTVKKFFVDPTAPVQVVEVDGLTAGENTLRVVTQDISGRESLPKGIVVDVYGESFYPGALPNRKFVKMREISGDSIEITFEKGGEEEAFDMTEVGAHCEIAGMSCGGVYKDAFFMHPPWQKGKTGCAYARVETTLPDEDELVFQASLGKRDRTDIGDGIHFMFFVAAEGQPETLLGETTLAEHKWIPFTADLSKWRGKKVTMRLVSDVGPTGNSTGDHAAWADMVIRKKEKILAYRLD